MADASDIQQVRLNVDEPTDETYSDDAIGLLVDALDVAGASASIWLQKAAKFASLVNVTEAGSTHNFSDLHKNALAMAKTYTEVEITVGVSATGPVIKTIVRET